MTRSATAGAETPHAGVHNAAERLLAVGPDDAIALVEGDSRVSYATLRHEVARCCARLRELEAGSRVGLLAENGLTFIAAYLACLRQGMCAVPLQVGIEPAALAGIAGETDMQLLMVSGRMADDPAVQGDSMRGVSVATPADRGDPTAAGAATAGGDRLAALLYTSGSTGKPKGVMVSHANIIANTEDILASLALAADDRVMLVLPLHYCYGLSVLHTHLAIGATVVVNNGFMFPERVLDDMERRECTGFAGVPSHYQILLRRTRFKQRELPTLRWLQQAGGRLPTPFVREIRDAFPDVRYYTMYGQTEATARLSCLPPERLETKMGSIGRGLTSTRLEVLDADDVAVRPGSGDVGEIVATGPGIAAGYWRDPVESARYFRGSRLRTGDLATVDEEGFIFIVDRARDFIKSMGNRVSSREVEEVIAERPEVVEVAVIGVPDDLWGEAIVAFVVTTTPEVDVGEIVDHCNARLPNAKVPTRIERVERLPKSSAGKLLKAELRRSLAGEGT